MKKNQKTGKQFQVQDWIETILLGTFSAALLVRIISFFLSGPVAEGLHYGSMIAGATILTARAVWWIIAAVKNKKSPKTQVQAG